MNMKNVRSKKPKNSTKIRQSETTLIGLTPRWGCRYATQNL